MLVTLNSYLDRKEIGTQYMRQKNALYAVIDCRKQVINAYHYHSRAIYQTIGTMVQPQINRFAGTCNQLKTITIKIFTKVT